MSQIVVRLSRSDNSPWGFRLQGGKDFGTPLAIQKVNMGSIAEKAGLEAGDTVVRVNNTEVFNLRHKDAQDVIVRAGSSFEVAVQRGGSTWKPTVIPTGAVPSHQQHINNVSPVTRTSLTSTKPAAAPIGTGHNLAAKPFNNAPHLNGDGPRLVNKQYNSPVGLYSEESIAETLSAQTEVLSTGVLGVNFKKNEKHYDATKSDVFRMLQEAEKEPSQPELAPTPAPAPQPAAASPVVPSPITGLRHVAPPENKLPSQPPAQQLPPGQNICADCERLIVGVFVRIKDKNLHVECFKCATCGASLKNVGYYNINSKLYCDIHAKLAAKNNPPAPNLVPVTFPPGKAPVGTISAALATHSYPTPAPLSPLATNQNSFAAPFQTGASLSSPRPFQSVSSPLSPPSNPSFNSVPSLIKAPSAPAPSAPVCESDVFICETNTPANPQPETPKGTVLQNINWPPVQPEEDFPTASPLYFPPPEVVAAHPPVTNLPRTKETDEELTHSVVQEDNYYQNTEISNANIETSKSLNRQFAVECVDTLTGALDTHMFVNSVLQNKSETIPSAMNKYTSYSATNKASSETMSYERNEQTTSSSTNNAICAQVTVKTFPPTCPMKSNPLEVDVEDYVPQVCPKTNGDAPLLQISDTERLCRVPCPPEECKNYQECPLLNSEKFKPIIDTVTVVINNPLPESWQNTSSQMQSTETQMTSSMASMQSSSLYAASNNYMSEQYDSHMVQALQTIPEKSAYDISQIPTKRSQSALASALAIAPVEPFNPLPPTTLDLIPLPEETSPYFPPADLFKIQLPEVKQEKPKKRQKWGKQAPEPEEDFLKDLPPIPDNKISMLTALTTAPDRCFSPLTCPTPVDSIFKESVCAKTIVEEAVLREVVKQIEVPKPEPTKPEPTASKTTALMPSAFKPLNPLEPFKPREVDYQPPPIPVIPEPETEKAKELVPEPEPEPEEEKMPEIVREIIKTNEITEYIKPTHFALHKPDYVPPYQTSVDELSTVTQSIKTMEINKEKKLMSQIPTRKPVTMVQPGHHQPRSPQMSFQPVSESDSRPGSRPSTSRPVSAMGITNKPPPVIPYYQLSIVPTHHLAVGSTLYDPRSRSPSPCPEAHETLFAPPPRRSPSPAPGPPPNPLNREVIETNNYNREHDAKQTLTSFIPQYQEKIEEAKRRVGASPRTVQSQSAYSSESSQSTKVSATPIPKGILKTSTTETQEMHHLEQQNASKYESVQKSADNSIEIKRTKTCTEEFEHTQKLKTIEIAKSSTTGVHFEQSQNSSQMLMNAESDYSNKSESQKMAERKMPVSVIQELKSQISPLNQQSQQQRDPQKPLTEIKLKVSVPNPPGRVPTLVPQPNLNVTANVPQQMQSSNSLPTRSLGVVPSSIPKSTASKAGPPISTQSYVPLPYSGAPGGRQQAVAGLSAPKRGRGVLNTAPLAGRVPLCGACNQNIRGPFITALGKIWCPEHFVCTTPSCRRPLQDLGFVEERGQLYCEFCFEQYLAPNCAKCNAKIKGDCLKAIGKHFHPECFNCAYCGKLFGNNPFFLEDGLPYCEADWNELFTTKCFACGFPVEAGDRWVEALNNNYHSQCFNCTMCKKNLEGQSFYAKGGRPFCKNHAR